MSRSISIKPGTFAGFECARFARSLRAAGPRSANRDTTENHWVRKFSAGVPPAAEPQLPPSSPTNS